jgi:hypothetical protein
MGAGDGIAASEKAVAAGCCPLSGNLRERVEHMGPGILAA